ncbi:MAG TPA: hypothetical protein VN048_04695 [Verrucomicrobiae bacterium]|nr:hypothetical protein [Verrucomicrobiae bacterium]
MVELIASGLFPYHFHQQVASKTRGARLLICSGAIACAIVSCRAEFSLFKPGSVFLAIEAIRASVSFLTNHLKSLNLAGARLWDIASPRKNAWKKFQMADRYRGGNGAGDLVAPAGGSADRAGSNLGSVKCCHAGRREPLESPDFRGKPETRID